jgi:putative thioredoxin
MPVLEKLATEYNGSFKLAKVNIDEQQELAQHHAVRSVPTVKLFKNGQQVEEFLGVQSESQIRALLDKHIVRESDSLMQQALARYQQGEQNAINDMITIINSDPNNTQLRILYVNVLFNEKKYDEAKTILEALPVEVRSSKEVSALLGQLDFLATANQSDTDIDTLKTQLADAPDNCELRYELSSKYVTQSRYEEAMQEFLEIMRRDRNFKEDAGRKGLLKLFDMLGGGELVTRYRQKMASLLN